MHAHATSPAVGGAPVAMLRSSSAPARCLRRAYAAVRAPARRGHLAGAGNRRARLRRRARARRASAPPARKKLPAFDYTALVASVAEIRALAVPTKVEVAVQADAYTLVLGLRGLEGKTALHVSWHPDAARVGLGPPPAARAQVREPLLRRAGAGGAPEPHPRRGLDPRALGTRRGVRVRRAARRPRRHPPSRRDAGPQLERDADERGRRRRRRRRRSYRTTIEKLGNDRGVRVSGGRESNLRASVLAGVRVPAAAARAGNLPGRLRRDSRRFGGRFRIPRGGDRRRAGEEARH